MRILYCAIDQTVPGTTGGSVHVTAVAEGLAALGHEVHVLVDAWRRGVSFRPALQPGALDCDGAAVWREATPMDAHRRGPAHRREAPAGGRHGALLQLRRRRRDGGRRGRRQDRARGQRAGHRSRRVGQGAHRPRAHRRAHAPVARAHLRARRPDRDAKRRNPSEGHAGAEDRAARVGRRYRPVPAGRSWRRAIRTAGDDRRDLRGRVQKLARRHQSRARDARAPRHEAAPTSAPCSSATARNCRPCRTRPPDLPNIVFTGAVPHAEHARVPGRCRHRRRPVRRRRAPAAVARLLLVAAQDFRVHGRWPPRRRSGGRSDTVNRRRRPRGTAVRPRAARGPRQGAGVADRPVAPTNARPRRPGARRPGVQLEGALRGTGHCDQSDSERLIN